MIGALTSAIAAAVVAERTKAEQCAGDQVEQIRRTASDSVGLVAGNPPGTVPPTAPCGSGFLATATVAISYKNDPTPTSYATGANLLLTSAATATATGRSFGEYASRIYTYDPNLQFLPPWFPSIDDTYTTAFFREVAP